MNRVVLNLFFQILSLLGGRLLVDQACVARTRLLRWSKKLFERKVSFRAFLRIVRATLIVFCVGSPAVFPRDPGGAPAATEKFFPDMPYIKKIYRDK